MPWLRFITVPMEPWYGIESIAAGIWGVPLGIVVTIVVSLLTPPPALEQRTFVDHVRRPGF